MQKIFTLSLFFILFTFVSTAQVEHKCGYIDAINKLEMEFPGVKETIDYNYLQSIEQAKSFSARRANQFDTVFTLQVVFHVLYQNAFENLHDSIILSQLEILNEDYRRLNADTGNTRDEFKDVAADAMIEFKLATVDPAGNPTSGINRVATNQSTFYDNSRSDRMKFSVNGGVDAWDTDKYLNIWICDYSIPNFGPAILGYAYPPQGANYWTNQTNNVASDRQGVMLHYQIVGRYNARATTSTLRYALGRTATHEVGHYLGLRHTWGDAQNANQGCILDDFIEDTPMEAEQAGFTANCDHSKNSCDEGADDLPDMIENYMDYSRNSCQNMFTVEQVRLMRSNLVNLRPGMAVSQEYVANPDFVNIAGEFMVLDNYTEDEFSIYIKDEKEDVKSVVVRSSIGEVVKEYKNLDEVTGQKFNATSLSSGIYFVTVYTSSGEEINTGKLVKK